MAIIVLVLQWHQYGMEHYFHIGGTIPKLLAFGQQNPPMSAIPVENFRKEPGLEFLWGNFLA
jgi:hypothetical protein